MFLWCNIYVPCQTNCQRGLFYSGKGFVWNTCCSAKPKAAVNSGQSTRKVVNTKHQVTPNTREGKKGTSSLQECTLIFNCLWGWLKTEKGGAVPCETKPKAGSEARSVNQEGGQQSTSRHRLTWLKKRKGWCWCGSVWNTCCRSRQAESRQWSRHSPLVSNSHRLQLHSQTTPSCQGDKS